MSWSLLSKKSKTKEQIEMEIDSKISKSGSAKYKFYNYSPYNFENTIIQNYLKDLEQKNKIKLTVDEKNKRDKKSIFIEMCTIYFVLLCFLPFIIRFSDEKLIHFFKEPRMIFLLILTFFSHLYASVFDRLLYATYEVEKNNT